MPADIAVLVATNAEAEQVTAALARRGIRASVARGGLLDTPEGTLVRAALRCAIDTRDARSRAVVDVLTGFGGQAAEAWLEGHINEHTAWLDAREAGTPLEARERPAAAGPLDALRAEVDVLAPSEAVDRILSVLDVAELAARWPDPDQRLANIDAIRALASRYEAGCKQRREAASIAGLLRYFDDVQRKVRVGNEELASDDQHTSHGPNSVTVTTYHRAKGLEWPVVLLVSLDRGPRRCPFNVLPASDQTAFDPSDPLGGRWIRYFPWPYGPHDAAPLRDVMSRTPEGQSVSEREVRERVRLLYVGFTRARDHLILAVRYGRQGRNAKWLDELCDAQRRPLLALPAPTETDRVPTATITGLGGRVLQVPTRVWSFMDEDAADGHDASGNPPASNGAPRLWFAKSSQSSTERPSHWIAPSRAALDWPEASTGKVAGDYVIGARLPLGSERPEDWNVVGDVLHAFLAADLPALGPPQRLELARRLLEAADLLLLLAPDALLRSADQLRRWIDRYWPDAVWHRELPVTGLLSSAAGARRIEGTIDLLLETAGGVVLIDHKSYPGRRSTWRDKAAEYVPQLGAYAAVLRMSGRRVLSQWLSFAVAGGVVEIVEREATTSGTAQPASREGT
jgi:ATP-dependent exoDNAse (exonuclease V) beta subunit